MNRFGPICGNEVGLWGHFVSMANEFLEENGVFGGVIPISVLRGKETGKIRDFILSNWTLLYVIKSTLNYGFSEWAEYRDILVIAKKAKPAMGHKTKFVLLKKDLRSLLPEDIGYIANRIEVNEGLRSEDLDIESIPIEELYSRFDNLMWFCGVSDLKNREKLESLVNNISNFFQSPSEGYFREGFRPFPKGASTFLFFTRDSDPSRREEAFLFFADDTKELEHIEAKTNLGINYQIEKTALIPTLRTPDWKKFWLGISRQTNDIKTDFIISRRINPYSPNSHLIAFYSLTELSPSDQLKVIKVSNPDVAKAFCVVVNSIIFLSQFFLLKEESTGRRIDIRLNDIKEMKIFPNKNAVAKLSKIFDQKARYKFPSLRQQLDTEFDSRYKTLWLRNRQKQKTLFEMDEIVNPSKERLAFDKAVCKALNLDLTDNEILSLYTVLVNEMIITLGLRKD